MPSPSYSFPPGVDVDNDATAFTSAAEIGLAMDRAAAIQHGHLLPLLHGVQLGCFAFCSHARPSRGASDEAHGALPKVDHRFGRR